MSAVISADRVGFWYGGVVALNGVTLEIAPGITGLLGPNGAGKTTLMRLVSGMLRPSAGAVRVLGLDPWDNPSLNLRIGLCPEHDGFYEWLTGLEFVRWLLRLRGFSRRDAARRAGEAIERVRLGDVADRKVSTYSRGMRQRLKLAQAVAHGAELLLLDEPLTGTDPLVRRELVDLVKSFAAEGKSVLVSSHVLHEIESLTRSIVLVHRGRLVAFGDRAEIRSLIDSHPHDVSIRTTRARALGAALAVEPMIVEIAFPSDDLVKVRTRTPDALYARLPALLLELGCDVQEIDSPDDSLDAVFRYLTAS